MISSKFELTNVTSGSCERLTAAAPAVSSGLFTVTLCRCGQQRERTAPLFMLSGVHTQEKEHTHTCTRTYTHTVAGSHGHMSGWSQTKTCESKAKIRAQRAYTFTHTPPLHPVTQCCAELLTHQTQVSDTNYSRGLDEDSVAWR